MKTAMQLGIIGLGRMGANISRRLIKGDHNLGDIAEVWRASGEIREMRNR